MRISRLTLMVLIATVMIALSGCSGKTDGHKASGAPEHNSTDPVPTQVYIQPLNTYTEADAKKVGLKLEQVTDEISMPVDVVVLPAVQLRDEFKNDANTRYRADKILNWLSKGPKPVIALINDDVSCSYKGIDDWGVLGLSYMGKDVCVVSTYRVKNKRDFWKVVYHEFGHAHYGLPHCPADNPTCIMRDAKGHPQLAPQKAICDSCWHSKHGHSR